jgi:hypothetical protein
MHRLGYRQDWPCPVFAARPGSAGGEFDGQVWYLADRQLGAQGSIFMAVIG